jgi:hypothetical protein
MNDRITITGIETLVVNAEMRNWILVKVLTDQDGLYGWGEASLNWKTRAVVGALEDLAPLLIGRDPRDIEQIVRVLNKHSYYRLGIIGATAISGIEHALWDIFGKSVGEPVWRLLGGRVRDTVRVYTHLGLGDMRAVYETVDVGPLREKAAAVVEQGYDALKVVIIPYGHHLTVAAERRNVDKLMSTLRSTRCSARNPSSPGTPKRSGRSRSVPAARSQRGSGSSACGSSSRSSRRRPCTSPNPTSTTPVGCWRASGSPRSPTPSRSGSPRTTRTARSPARPPCTSRSAPRTS